MRLKLKLKVLIRDFPEEGVFAQGILQKPRSVTSSRFFYSHLLIVLLQNIKHTTLAENGENLISAHSQDPKI